MRLILPMIIQTTLLDPTRAVWTDEASNVSRLDPSGADQIDAEHPSRNRKVGGRIRPRGPGTGHDGVVLGFLVSGHECVDPLVAQEGRRSSGRKLADVAWDVGGARLYRAGQPTEPHYASAEPKTHPSTNQTSDLRSLGAAGATN